MTPEQFRATREALGLNQAELAEALDMTRENVNRFESGKRPIRLVLALAMEALLNRRKCKMTKSQP